MAQMMRVSGRPLHVNIDEGENPAWIQSCRAEGLPLLLQRQCTFGGVQFKLAEYNLFDYMPNWVQPLVGSPEERAAKLRDPNSRAAMKRDMEESLSPTMTDWSTMRVLEVVHERNHKYEGMTIQELAVATGGHPLDAFLNLALDEGLETEFEIPPRNSADDVKLREQRFKAPYAPISQSDGGAHNTR